MSDIALNMPAAAERLSLPLSEIKRAKRGGCDGFLRSGRIAVAKVKAWLELNPGALEAQQGEPVDLTSLESSLKAAVSVEGDNLRLLRAAQVRNDALAVRELSDAYQRAQKNRLATEKEVRAQLERAGQLLTLDQHKIQLNRLWTPIVTSLRKLPGTLAMKLCPTDDVAAEKVIGETIEDLIAEARKSLTMPADPEFHLKIYLLSVLQKGEANPESGIASLKEVMGVLRRTATAKTTPAAQG